MPSYHTVKKAHFVCQYYRKTNIKMIQIYTGTIHYLLLSLKLLKINLIEYDRL
jgi:hypothetical protein